MSSNPKKRSFTDHSKMPKRENQGFVVVKKKKNLPSEPSLHSKNLSITSGKCCKDPD